MTLSNLKPAVDKMNQNRASETRDWNGEVLWYSDNTLGPWESWGTGFRPAALKISLCVRGRGAVYTHQVVDQVLHDIVV